MMNESIDDGWMDARADYRLISGWIMMDESKELWMDGWVSNWIDG